MYVRLHQRKEVKTMKYETPELTALTPAINAIQDLKDPESGSDNGSKVEITVGAYQDWE
jgi:hypothetical protein